jgi:ABC-type uncharacterized transport system auxiliary subunit
MMRAALLALFAWLLPACSLMSKAEPLDVTYFDPPIPPAATANPPANADIELRLDRVWAAEHLRSRIAYREHGVEIGFYESKRWAERPDTYLGRALTRALFVDKGMTQALSGTRPALDVELLAFEEVREGKRRSARVSVRYTLRDDRRVVAADVVTVERPVAPQGDTSDLARALGAALDGAVDGVSARVTDVLSAARPRAAEASAPVAPASP